jgi:hypothetical protein
MLESYFHSLHSHVQIATVDRKKKAAKGKENKEQPPQDQAGAKKMKAEDLEDVSSQDVQDKKDDVNDTIQHTSSSNNAPSVGSECVFEHFCVFLLSIYVIL